MKIAVLLAVVFLGACGRSECQKAAAVYCDKIALCGVPVVEGDGSVRVHRIADKEGCEREALESTYNSDTSEEQCEATRARMLPMSCPAFFDFMLSVQ